MNEQKPVCDDSRLLAMLADELNDHEMDLLFQHVSTCSDCQNRTEELAATESEWANISDALIHQTEPPAFLASRAYSDAPGKWSESIAKQLLSPPSHPEMLGRLGRYEIERLIGVGGMGVVFKAHDSELIRPVAIKVLAPYLSGSGVARQRFAREARAAAAVVHQHVVPIHNVETERESPFLVMHYVAGESLQTRIDREGPLELEEILRIGMQVASGLSAAHQQGLVHRDIKPSNILLEEASVERALITDFGLAQAADDVQVTRTGVFMGTPQYMSPEQARGESVDQQSDLFSLGSVLYTLCTGRPAFRADSPLVVMRRITDDQPTPIRELNPKIPKWFCGIISKLISKEKQNRYADAAEVSTLLKGCLNHIQQPDIVPLPSSATTVEGSTMGLGGFKLPAIILGATLAAFSILGGIAFLQNQLGKDQHVSLNSENENSIDDADAGGKGKGTGEAAGTSESHGANEPEPKPVALDPNGEVEILGHGYARQGKFILFDNQQIDNPDNFDQSITGSAKRVWELAKDVDADSFRALSQEYTKDKHKVYFKRANSRFHCFVELDDADPSSFQVVSQNLAKDSEKVWWHGKTISNIDPISLAVVRDGDVWKDANHVWFRNERIEKAHPGSFKHLGHHYYKDDQRVYWVNRAIEGADPLTFRTFGDEFPYGRDRDSAWYKHSPIDNVDHATFDVVHPYIYKDRNGVYAHGAIVPNARPDSFRKLSTLDGGYVELFTDEQTNFVYLSQYAGTHEVTLDGESLRVTRQIIDWNLPQPAVAGESSAVLTPDGWQDHKAPEPFKKTSRSVLSLYQTHFERARKILATQKPRPVRFNRIGVPGNIVDMSDDQQTLILHNRPDVDRAIIGSPKLWDLKNNRELATLPESDEDGWHWRFVPNRKLCIACSKNRVRLWDYQNSKWIGDWIEHTVGGATSPIRLPAFSATGDHMAVIDGRQHLQFWNLSQPEPLAHDAVRIQVEGGRDGSPDFALQFSADAQYCFLVAGGQLTVWDPTSGKKTAGPFAHDILDIAYSETTGSLASVEHSQDDTEPSSVMIHSANQGWNKVRSIPVPGKMVSIKWMNARTLLTTGLHARRNNMVTADKELPSIVAVDQDNRPKVQLINRDTKHTVPLPDGTSWVGVSHSSVFLMKVGQEDPIWESPVSAKSFPDEDKVRFSCSQNNGWIAVQRSQWQSRGDLVVYKLTDGMEMLHQKSFVRASFAGTSIAEGYQVHSQTSKN